MCCGVALVLLAERERESDGRRRGILIDSLDDQLQRIRRKPLLIGYLKKNRKKEKNEHVSGLNTYPPQRDATQGL